MARITNPNGKTDSMAEAMDGADVFVGVSAPGIVSEEMVRSMAEGPIVFAMANPVPEIMPDLARDAGARVIATGRSDFPNQVNNVLGFPGIFRGALDVRAREINQEMNMAAARAIAELAEPVSADRIIPSPFDRRVVPKVAEAVAGRLYLKEDSPKKRFWWMRRRWVWICDSVMVKLAEDTADINNFGYLT
jgi:malate dehydrogenase (oxaloacetate-decarboxylating)